MTVQRLDAIFNTVTGYLPNLQKETPILQKEESLRLECICYKILYLFLLMAFSIISSFHFIVSVFLIRCLVIGSAAAGLTVFLFPKRAEIFVPVSVILISFALGQASMVLAKGWIDLLLQPLISLSIIASVLTAVGIAAVTKVPACFKKGAFYALVGIAIAYIVNTFLHVALDMPAVLLYGQNRTGLLFSLLVLFTVSANLYTELLDIRSLPEKQHARYYEWMASFKIVALTVLIYRETLNLVWKMNL